MHESTPSFDIPPGHARFLQRVLACAAVLLLVLLAAAPHTAHAHKASDAYLHGLRDFGWSGDESQVLLTRAVVVALQMSTFFAAHLSWICDQTLSSLVL